MSRPDAHSSRGVLRRLFRGSLCIAEQFTFRYIAAFARALNCLILQMFLRSGPVAGRWLGQRARAWFGVSGRFVGEWESRAELSWGRIARARSAPKTASELEALEVE